LSQERSSLFGESIKFTLKRTASLLVGPQNYVDPGQN
jgi:hypothetical protein